MQLRHPLAKFGVVLLGQDLSWGHKGSLQTSINGRQQSSDGHHCFATTHITLNESGHGLGLSHISQKLLQNALLCVGQTKGQ